MSNFSAFVFIDLSSSIFSFFIARDFESLVICTRNLIGKPPMLPDWSPSSRDCNGAKLSSGSLSYSTR